MKTLGQLLPQLSGARVVGQADVAINRVHTDTRSLQPGDLFVALKGERFDAHDFLPQAQAAGAVPEEELPEAPAKSGPEAPSDPVAREKAISDAMTQMVVDARRDDFTAAGLPHLRVLKQVLGWEVPAPERDAVWAKLNQSSEA